MAELITTSFTSLLSSACADYSLTLPDTSSPIGPHQMELSQLWQMMCILCVRVCMWLHIWSHDNKKSHSAGWSRPLLKNTSRTGMELSRKVANSVFCHCCNLILSAHTLTRGQQAFVRCCWSTTPTHVEAQRFRSKKADMLSKHLPTLSTVARLFVRESQISVKLHRYRCQPAPKAWTLFLMCPFPWMELWHVIRYIPGHAWSIGLSTESDYPFCAVCEACEEDSLPAIYRAHSCVRRATLLCDCRDPPLTLIPKGSFMALFHFALNSVIPPFNCVDPHSPAFRAPFVLLMALVGHIGAGIKEIWCDSGFEELDMLNVTLTDLRLDLGHGVSEAVIFGAELMIRFFIFRNGTKWDLTHSIPKIWHHFYNI